MNSLLYQARKKTPTILQMEATECGATSLSIIMAYYGKFISAEEAREACDISRDGSKAINIVKAARNYGMDAHGLNLEIDELNEVETPFIAYWEFDHFLVVDGYNKKKVFLNDPATGPRTVNWEEFDRAYTGIVLDITPGEKFKKSGKKENLIFPMFLQHINGNYMALIFAIAITIALIIPEIAVPIFSKMFIDNILIDQQTYMVPMLLMGIFASVALTFFFTLLQQWCLLRFKIKLKIINAVSFVWHMLHVPIRFFQQRASGDIIERNFINEELSNILSDNIPAAIVDIIKIVLLSMVIFLLSWKIMLLVIAATCINLLFLSVLYRQFTDTARRNGQDRAKLSGIEFNGIKIIETLKAAALEQHFFIRWAAYYAKTLNSQQKLIVYETAMQIVPDLINSITSIAILCFGAFLVMKGQMTIGTIVAIQALMINFRQTVSELFQFSTHLQQTKGDMIRLNDLIKTKPDKILQQDDVVVDDLATVSSKYILELKHVTFGYSKLEPPIFDNLSIKIKQGERIAVIGPSGGGKSSLTKLICATYETGKGKVLINHLPFSKISRNALSNFIAYVDQNICLFSGTLRENLTLYKSEISDEEIEQALITSCIYNDIIQRGGLYTQVVEGGINFSGGQLQRIEIARALLQKPKILILDEATSAVDPLVEENIYKNLLAQNCSLVIIAHRLSAIRDCDKIYVLEEGRIIQQGSHQELIAEEGLYRQLVTMEQL